MPVNPFSCRQLIKTRINSRPRGAAHLERTKHPHSAVNSAEPIGTEGTQAHGEHFIFGHFFKYKHNSIKFSSILFK